MPNQYCGHPENTFKRPVYQPDLEQTGNKLEYDLSDRVCALEDEATSNQCDALVFWWENVLNGTYDSFQVTQIIHGAIIFVDTDFIETQKELSFLRSILHSGVYDE